VSTLLLVHAHPDDESILTGGVIARAHLDHHRVVLVTATRGEEGTLVHLDAGVGPEALADIRTQELQEACEILGVDRLEMLGYHDSGMPGGGGGGGDHQSFHDAPLREVAERLVDVLEEERPEVVVTYSEDGTYEHPDHRKAHQMTIEALDRMATRGWEPYKVYAHAVPRSYVRIVLAAADAHGIELPAELAQIAGIPDERITTVVDVSDVLDRKLAAVVAHRSQMHPGLALATMAAQLFEATFGVERFVLVRGEPGSGHPESSLFEGLA
jgi:LmbE family N-acetylglucosaminyl deacetylase